MQIITINDTQYKQITDFLTRFLNDYTHIYQFLRDRKVNYDFDNLLKKIAVYYKYKDVSNIKYSIEIIKEHKEYSLITVKTKTITSELEEDLINFYHLPDIYSEIIVGNWYKLNKAKNNKFKKKCSEIVKNITGIDWYNLNIAKKEEKFKKKCSEIVRAICLYWEADE